ncbi:MAG TPA: TonB family protein [Allosphingosinicella sp.]|nr:TonB family protein [Allosphingosinicella sp.]
MINFLLLGASMAAATPDDAPEVPMPPPLVRMRALPAPEANVPPPAVDEELRAYLETRGARPARFRYGAIGFEDYPAAAIRAGEQGIVGVRYLVGPAGRVTSCEIVESSASAVLDATTCSIAQRRFRFYPAQDDAGNATSETRTQRVHYSLPDDPPPAPEAPPR